MDFFLVFLFLYSWSTRTLLWTYRQKVFLSTVDIHHRNITTYNLNLHLLSQVLHWFPLFSARVFLNLNPKKKNPTESKERGESFTPMKTCVSFSP